MGRTIYDSIYDAMIFTLMGATFGLIAGGKLARHDFKETLEALRLSERKIYELKIEERQDLFEKKVVPTHGLRFGTLEYAVHKEACVNGIYGSKSEDWKVSTEDIAKTYDLCGWKVK